MISHKFYEEHWTRLTVKGNPCEARASTQTTSDLVDPRVIELHPVRLAGTEVAGLDIFPEALALEVLASLSGVERPLAFACQLQELDGADKDRARRWVEVVFTLAEPEDDGTEAEHDSGQQPRAPEALK